MSEPPKLFLTKKKDDERRNAFVGINPNFNIYFIPTGSMLFHVLSTII